MLFYDWTRKTHFRIDYEHYYKLTHITSWNKPLTNYQVMWMKYIIKQ